MKLSVPEEDVAPVYQLLIGVRDSGLDEPNSLRAITRLIAKIERQRQPPEPKAEKKPKPLTEDDWRRIFRLRCESKRGGKITRAEVAFCHRGFEEDPERYDRMSKEVFEATKPFGA